MTDKYLDEKSYLLFDRTFNNLGIAEQMLVWEYIDDLRCPEWAPIYINGEDTGYQVSNTGTILKPNNTIYYGYGYDRLKKYIDVSLSYNGKILHSMMHRLVAEAFIPNPENKPEVNHINGNKHLNWYRNLEWNTRQENATHAKETGLMPFGEKVKTSKYKESDAHAVCKLAEAGKGADVIAKELNISKAFVIGIMFRNEWSHISKNYNMPKHKSFSDEETIHKICKLLSEGKGPSDISNELNINRSLAETVRQGKAWRQISNQYNIPGLYKVEVRDKLSNKIYKLFDEGIFDTNEIIKLTGMENTRGHKNYIAKVRRKYYRDNQNN
jgi:hypothetical protein